MEELLKLRSGSLHETAAFAASLAQGLASGTTLALVGNLGAGKTALARALIQSLLGDPGMEVASPTFTLVNEYLSAQYGPIWHIDLYRIEDAAELSGLGLSDALGDHICIIEWPDRAVDLMPEDTLWIRLETTGRNERTITLAGDARWRPNLNALFEGVQ